MLTVERSVKHNGFLGQPFQTGSICHSNLSSLLRFQAVTAIDFCCRSRCQQGLGIGLKLDMNGKLIATHNSPSRVQDNAMTDRVAFWIERALHFQRSLHLFTAENGFIGSTGKL
jgi:hypothetical protein